MFGMVSEELEVRVPAKKVWELYASIKLTEVALECLPEAAKVDILEGDGGVGTILNIFFVPGHVTGFTSYKEKFTKVDNEKLVKEVEIIEGAYLDIGFTYHRIRFEIIEKTENSCITRATIEFGLKEEAAANISFVSIQRLVAIMKGAASYLLKENEKRGCTVPHCVEL